MSGRILFIYAMLGSLENQHEKGYRERVPLTNDKEEEEEKKKKEESPSLHAIVH